MPEKEFFRGGRRHPSDSLNVGFESGSQPCSGTQSDLNDN